TLSPKEKRLLAGMRKIGHWKLWSRYECAGLALLPWLVVAINALVAKHNQILTQAVSDALVGAPPYAFRTHIYQFTPDLLTGFMVVPATILLLMNWIPRRWMLVAVSIGALLWQMIMSTETATYAMANSYATFRTMLMGVMWAVRHPKNQFLTLPLFDKINV